LWICILKLSFIFQELPNDIIAKPLRNHPVWINIVAMVLGSFFILAILIMFLTFKKLKHEKMKHRAMERVNQWTKKVIVLKPALDQTIPGITETLVGVK
jgi:fibroblast growth factor receptor 2